MNNWALKTLPVGKFGEELSIQAKQLLTSQSIQDVCDSICKNLKSNSELNLFNVSGLTGSGRTTFCKAVMKNLIQNHVRQESDILYIKIDKNDNPNCVWNSGIQFARVKNLGSITTVLAAQSSTLKEKEIAMVSVFDSFKVVCFDNLPISERNGQLYALLMSIIHKLKTNVICVLKPNSPLPQYGTLVQVDGLNPAVITNGSTWQKIIQNVVDLKTGHLNPKAVQMLANASQVLGVVCNYKAVGNQNPVLDVLNLIWMHLSDNERVALLELSELRRALPLKDAGMLSRPIQVGLVDFKPPGTHGNLFGEVILSDCVQEFILRKKGEGTKFVRTSLKFDVLQYWMILLSDELVGLIKDARSYSWPFIPEKWQYVKNASKKESYNVKDLITMKVKNLPHLTHFDVLQETLHHSVLRKDHENMAAILFLIDRYIYWQGGSQTLLNIVDSIMKEKPELPIAPQLVIRKARVLRTSGNLQGAEKVLDELVGEKQVLGMWRYKEKHHYDLVKAVCVQIKGEIQATLGHWYDSAVLLLDSVHLFKALPKVDKKGLSCSLGLLCNTLHRMSVEEFKLIAQRYFLKAPHPYIQAYQFAIEAADMAIYTPLFYARHKRRAGEMLFEYSQIVQDDPEQEYLTNALKELKESLAAHKTFDSLKSREQYYEFISALYKASCVLEFVNNGEHGLTKFWNLKSIAMSLFYHYCLNQTSIVHDDWSKTNINTAIKLLHLPSYREIDFFMIGTTSSLVYGPSKPIPGADEEPARTPMVDRCAETVQTLTISTQGSTVNRSLTADVFESYQLDVDQLIRDTKFNGFNETCVHECEVESYDPVHLQWRRQRTLLYIGEPLSVSEDNEGGQRVPYMVEYLSQEEPLGKYVGKRYRKPLGMEQYKEDVRCQMTARYYVGLFNQELYHKGIEVSPIQFLPVVMVTLLEHNNQANSVVYNVEPFMQGDFKKLTNNWNWVEKEGAGSKLVLAFSHFTIERSNNTLLITDHQGWTTEDHLSTTFLTDPQIHSFDKTLYGTGNLGKRGIDTFWQDMHSQCNDICRQLGLKSDRYEKNGH